MKTEEAEQRQRYCDHPNCDKKAKYVIEWTTPTGEGEAIASSEGACNFMHAYELARMGGIINGEVMGFPENMGHPAEQPTRAVVISSGRRHVKLEKLLEEAHTEGWSLYQKVYGICPYEQAERKREKRKGKPFFFPATATT